MRAAAAGAAFLGVVVFGACGAHDVDLRMFVGPVLEVDGELVCIGADNATGECFVQDERTSDLAIGDCVRVSYRTDVGKPGLSVEDVEMVVADAHDVCTTK
ncbi:hypothetical protein HNR19_002607 [Nocardioides thalensis]|uniref:Uncharacterized protein n=1 Tax=Nocardioides thalensis TaxID=1914755 RepID=A0A853C3N5_9ACTN|nr:hypothetical protein [Nocardioides thalensis]NYJ01909.1 hypothetical protein [Nocardioides thalensis]